MPSLQSLLLLTLATLAGTSLAAPAPLEARADDAAKSLYADLFSSPTALGRFQRLLVEPTTGALLGGDALKKAASFDYNNAAGDKAGKISAAVAATFPLLVKQDIGTVVAFLGPCR